MVVPEHLNWHPDFEEYAQAKGNIFRFQKPGNRAVYYPANETSARLVELSAGEHVPYGQAPGAEVVDGVIRVGEVPICQVSEVALPGPHNLQNICAAVTAVWELVDHNPEPLAEVIRSFAGLPHHLELVAEVDGVKYYDDSFSTTPETAVAALRSFAGDKVAILGGSDKGIGFAELVRAVEDERVIHALLIGDTAPDIARELDKVGFSHYTLVKWQGMAQLIQTASHLAEPGDIVLLSPGCASFGLFANYKERGQQFQEAVMALADHAA
jgi:UDP-N-acetylmuramoylalanine--D-glutamate ligase